MSTETINHHIIFERINDTIIPEFSIVVPVYNQEKIISKNLQAIVDYTIGLFELIIIIDCCSDNSEQIILDWVKTNDIQIRIAKSIIPLFETSADNIGFRMSRGGYCLEIQADMEMTEKGYNNILKRGFQYTNVIGVSGRCCHMLNEHKLIGRGGESINRPYDKKLRQDLLYVNETVNRGPLLLDRKKLMEMNYLDEENFYLDNSDHDLFTRAWAQKGWICGYIPIDFNAPLENGSTRKPRDAINTYYFQERSKKSNGGFLKKFMMDYIEREPSILQLKI
jgi:glycosyltransferase involved in cell wall biosynthesis|uniref:Glycosyltransferase 2-like domain-containing protein n=1 Tax=viral metagenome TaxID=1070528 RepID=A0A6C0BJ06_9ZZZZ